MFFPHVYEAAFYPTLARIPMSLRLPLDLAGLKVHLKSWTAVPLDERWALATHPCETGADLAAFAARLTEAVRRATGAAPDPAPAAPRPAPWEIVDAPPPDVADRAAREGIPLPLERWAAFPLQQRFALCKLAASRHEPQTFAVALREFLTPPAPEGVAGCVLAGGRSSRFGSDKTRLQIAGESLATRGARILREAGLQRVWIVGNGRRGLQTPIRDVESLPDDVPCLGPAGGIATALLRSPGGVFAVAADMPALSPELVRAVIDAWDGHSPACAPGVGGAFQPRSAAATAAAPQDRVGEAFQPRSADTRWEPLCALYRLEALPALYLAAGDRHSLQEMLTGLPAQRIDLPPSLVAGLVNVNTREEWSSFQTTTDVGFKDSRIQ